MLSFDALKSSYRPAVRHFLETTMLFWQAPDLAKRDLHGGAGCALGIPHCRPLLRTTASQTIRLWRRNRQYRGVSGLRTRLQFAVGPAVRPNGLDHAGLSSPACLSFQAF